MALDGIVTRSIVNELKQKLIGKKINRIYQIGNRELAIHFRDTKLMISASPDSPRLYLTEEKFDNPSTPPLFSMVMRKHLNGGVIKDVHQYGNDRVVRLNIDCWDDFSQIVEKSLIIEIMGRHSNIILVEKDDTIIDAITRVNSEMSRVREVLPGLKYKYLSDDTKIQPIDTNREDILNRLQSIESNRSVENEIFSNFVGFSKTVGTEIATRSGLDPSKPYSSLTSDELNSITDNILNLSKQLEQNKYYPKIYKDGDRILDFHVIEMTHLAGPQVLEYGSPSEMLSNAYKTRARQDALSQSSRSIRRRINRTLARDQNKLSNQKLELQEAEDREKYKIWADVLSANLYKVSPGDEEITLENFYSETLEKITIPLNPKYSPPVNAQRFYKRYKSLNNAEKILKEQIEDTEIEIQYLESVLSSIDLAETTDDIEEIKNELIAEGYLKRNRKAQSKAKKIQTNYREFYHSGYKILVGRNNRENDLITFKEASRDDLWLHAQNIPGSHVIIKNAGANVSEKTLKYAASLAAYNSTSRDSGPINVDYTERLNVKRHPARKPGLVNYTDFKTIYVESSKPGETE